MSEQLPDPLREQLTNIRYAFRAWQSSDTALGRAFALDWLEKSIDPIESRAYDDGFEAGFTAARGEYED